MKHLLVPKKHRVHADIFIPFLEIDSEIMTVTEVKIIVYYILFDSIQILYCLFISV